MICSNCKSQSELIQNGGFDAGCDTLTWEFVNSVDYYSTRDIDCWQEAIFGQVYKAPDFFAGNQHPQSGSGFAGFVFWNQDYAHREYLVVALEEDLKEGDEYELELYLAARDSSIIHPGSFVFWFTEELTYEFRKNRRHLTAQYPVVLDGFEVNDTTWTQIRYDYQAKGKEKYLVIGNCLKCTKRCDFNRNFKKYRKENAPLKYTAYYFIDSVSLKLRP